MANIIIAVLLVACICGAIFYIRNKKKHGARCIGCPCANHCAQKCTGCHSQAAPERPPKAD